MELVPTDLCNLSKFLKVPITYFYEDYKDFKEMKNRKYRSR